MFVEDLSLQVLDNSNWRRNPALLGRDLPKETSARTCLCFCQECTSSRERESHCVTSKMALARKCLFYRVIANFI